MKKMGKLMVGLLLSTVLVMAVLGCENPASGGGDSVEATLTDLVGTWKTDFNVDIDGSPPISIVYKGYQTFKETNVAMYVEMDVLSIGKMKSWSPEMEVAYVFNGSTVTMTAMGESQKLTFNTKTSFTMEMPPESMPPSMNFPTSITYTKISNPSIPKHSLIGTWKANANEYVFTENTIKMPNADIQNMVYINEEIISGQNSSATVTIGNPPALTSIDFVFTDSTKDKFQIKNMDNTLGTDIYTKQ